MSKLSAAPAVQLPVQPLPIREAAAASRPSPAADAAKLFKSANAAKLSQSADPAQLFKSAQDFEAMAIGQLLQPMFDTVNTAKGAFGGGAGEEAWKPMMVQEFAKQMAAHGGLGLAKPVYDAMLRMQEANKK